MLRRKNSCKDSRLLMKFGGSSLATPSLIRRAAARVAERLAGSCEVIVVVSAMGEETDRLLTLANEISSVGAHAELDAVLAAGEQVAAGLMALALGSHGLQARSFMAHQLPIHCSGPFGQGEIQAIGTDALFGSLKRNEIPVVAGFQGMGFDQRIMTLGRGGSDTTAVALAIALEADFCEFYKDVDGVHAQDPRRYPLARKLDFVTYEEMGALVRDGAQVLHDRAVQLASLNKMPLHLRSSSHGGQGTWVGTRDTLVLEQNIYAEEKFA